MNKEMTGGKIVGQLPRAHRCSEHLPKKPLFARKKRFAGLIAECTCGTKYVWVQRWSWADYLGWGWDKYSAQYDGGV